MGDDQREQYFEDHTPAFLVYCGATIVNGVLDLPAGAPLALHLVGELLEREFDISYAEKLAQPRGEGHAFGFVHRRLMGGNVVPVVPLVVNTYYPPNQFRRVVPFHDRRGARPRGARGLCGG